MNDKSTMVVCLDDLVGETLYWAKQSAWSLEEHDKQVRTDAIEEYTEWLRKSHANFDEDYAEDIKSDYLEQLKGQKNEIWTRR